MPFPPVARYADLVKSIISGSFYESLGIVIPYRFETTDLRIETGELNTKFGIYINEVFSGEETSDPVGNIICRRKLPLGEVEVTLLSNSSGRSVKAYLTVRDYAIWLASYAENLETIDANIDQVRDNLAIETAELTALNDVYGNQIGMYSDLGLSLDSYRYQVHELRTAYREFGARWLGLEQSIGEITQVLPFGYSRRKWGPNWVLDQNMLVNHRFDQRSAYVYKSTNNLPGLEVLRVEADMPSNYANPNRVYWTGTHLTWVPNAELTYVYPIPVSDGEMFLPGTFVRKNAFITGRYTATTFSIDSVLPTTNNKLYLNIDNLGEVVVTLTSGTPTPATIAADINNALFSDVRYGVSYLSTADASTLTGYVILESPQPTSAALYTKVEILHGTGNAAAEIFGTNPGDIVTIREPFPGVEIVSINGYHKYLTQATLYHRYNASLTNPHGFAYRSLSYSTLPYVYIPESGEYTFYDSSGNSITIYVTIEDLYSGPTTPYTELETFSLGYSKVATPTYESRGLWVNVDKDVMQVTASGNDTIIVRDDLTDGEVELPDNWYFDSTYPGTASAIYPSEIVKSKTNDSFDPVSLTHTFSPAEAYKLRITGTGVTTVELIAHVHRYPLSFDTPRGQNFPQRNWGGFYDYEGFEAKVSGWFRSILTKSTNVSFSLSFDGGDTWTTMSPVVAMVQDMFGYLPMTYAEFSMIIPANISIGTTWVDSGVLVKVTVDTGASANVTFEMDSLSLEIKYISSRYLTNNTVVRSGHRQNFGELLWVWSPEPLTTNEKHYLGLPHVMAFPTVHFGAVEITNIDYATIIGNGTIEYEYNSTGNTKKLRWTPYGLAWALGMGWVSIISDGSYVLTAPDSTTITVNAYFSILATLTGTMPVVQSRSVLISNNTSNSGHLQRISPAHSSIDIFDVTEYDANLVPKNLVGAVTEADFGNCGFVNSNYSVADPFKYSFVYPEYPPQTGETLTLVLNGANYEALLDYYSDQDQDNTVLYADGIPIPNNMWSFYVDPITNYNYIRILATWFPTSLSTASVYTVDYNLLYQFTTSYLDLGATFQDYCWFVDYFLWERMNKVLGEYDAETPIYFNTENGRAYLTKKSTANKSLAKLFVQTSTELMEIPKSNWRFIDDRTVELDKVYLVNGQYYLDHQEKRVYSSSDLVVLFEHRSAETTNACSLATWNIVERNDNVYVHQASNPHQFHQLRLSVSGIRDLRDFRIRSLYLKGLNLHSTTPNVAGLTSNWLGA